MQRYLTAPHQIHNRQEHDRANERYEQRNQVKRIAVDGRATE